MNILLFFYGVLNLFVFLCYAADKRRARRQMWRIPERTLLILAVLGVIGAATGVFLLRHKTRKKKFAIGVPLIAVLEALLFVTWMISSMSL